MLSGQARSYITFSTHYLIQPRHQILRTQVGVALQHLHGLVAGDGGDFLITKAGLDQARDGFVAQVVEAQAPDAGGFQGAVPGRAGFIRTAYAITAGFAEEDQVGTAQMLLSVRDIPSDEPLPGN